MSAVETVVEKQQLPRNGAAQHFTVGRNVVLQACVEEGERERDSDRANSQVLCEYKWDPKTTYEGRILTTRDKLVAYRLFNEQTGEAVRVLERESRARHLIRDFNYSVVDVQFANHAPLLAVLDKNANVYIYHVNEDTNELTKYLNIVRSSDLLEFPGTPRLVWCSYMDDEARETHILAIYYDKIVEIFFLNAIKEHFNLIEVSYDEINRASTDGSDTMKIAIETESQITSVRLSPDATACAVATIEGEFMFYILGNGKGQETLNLHPFKNQINDLLFLDNLSHNDNMNNPYWKYVVLVSENGRKLGIYSCYNWECVAKLRIETSIQTSKLEAMIDTSARFIYLADYERSNLFVLEIAPVFPRVQPFFVAASQISFHQHLLCVNPCNILEVSGKDDSDDLLLDEEDSTKPPHVVVTFAAITNRSLLDLKVEVDKSLDISLNEDPEVGSKIIEDILEAQTKQLMLSNKRLNSSGSHEQDSSRRSHYDDHVSPRTSDSNYDAATNQELKKMRALLQTITDREAATEKRLNEMNIQLEKVHKDNADLRREQTDNLADVLEKISNEMRNRDDHIEQTVKRMNTDLRADVKRIVEQTLNDNAVSLQSTMETTNTRVVESIKAVMGQVLVPSLEQLCGQLFLQLNERFKEGLNEFIDQMKVNQSHAATPVLPDYNVLAQMIEQNRLSQAFEYVLTRHDYAGLIYVCNALNPDTIFNDSTNSMSPSVLLGLLQALGQKFELDTDLKFNYLENIMVALRSQSPGHIETCRHILEQVSGELIDFTSQEKNNKYKRQGRLVNQLILFALKV